MPASDLRLVGTSLLDGVAHGQAVKLTEPLNAWGELDPETGVIVHDSHPQCGVSLAGRVLVMQESRGSGANAQVFAQAWANGNGPVGVVLSAPDYVLCAGAVVSRELYNVTCPIVLLDPGQHARLADGDVLALFASDSGATVTVKAPPAMGNVSRPGRREMK